MWPGGGFSPEQARAAKTRIARGAFRVFTGAALKNRFISGFDEVAVQKWSAKATDVSETAFRVIAISRVP
jgi:hypothetical protein